MCRDKTALQISFWAFERLVGSLFSGFMFHSIISIHAEGPTMNSFMRFLPHGSSLQQLVPITERHSLVRHNRDMFGVQLHM